MASNNGNSRSTFDDGDSFYDDMKMLNPRYHAQLQPYLNYNYKNGILDRLGNFFGFNTGEDRYRMEMQDRARQMLGSLLNDQFQNDYNSAKAQASRQRDAGLNPDLAGDASGDPAAQMEQPLSPIDPSVFEVPQEVMADITGILGMATQGLTSVASFAKLLADRKEVKTRITANKITSLQAAFTLAGDWLSGFDPVTRLNLGDAVNPDAPEAERREQLKAAIASAFHSDIDGLDEDSKSFLNKAFLARTSDPRVMDNFYDAYSKAAESRAKKMVVEENLGSLDLAEELVRSQNNIMYAYLVGTYEDQVKLNALVNSYNLEKTQNDFDYESWKAEHKLPIELGESELQSYLAYQAKSKADAARAKATQNWLNELLGLKKKHDPGATYLFNALIQGGYAPLMQYSGKGGIGPLNFGGSWTSMINPGSLNLQPMSSEQVGNTATQVHLGQPHM